MKIVVTGHVPYQQDKKTKQWFSKLETPRLPARSKDLFRALVACFMEKLKESPEYQNKEIECVIQGLAKGWDLACAVGAIKLGIPVISYLPYQGHGNWSTFYKDIHDRVLDKTVVIEPTSPELSIRDQLLLRNRNMLSNLGFGDQVHALHNGSGGGTGYTVKEAQKSGLHVENYWSYWEQLREEFPDREVKW